MKEKKNIKNAVKKQQEFVVEGKIPFNESWSLRYQLRLLIHRAVCDLWKEAKNLKIEDVKMDSPVNKNYGDYSSNIAFFLAGRLSMKPNDIAGEIKTKLEAYIRKDQTISLKTDSIHDTPLIYSLKDILVGIQVVFPGFLNLSISSFTLITQTMGVLEKIKAGIAIKNVFPCAFALSGKKISVEYTDPNPFKEFHLGHLYSNAIGESVSRLLEACGATVWRGDFYGDVGMHIAKSLYGLFANFKFQISNFKFLKGEEYTEGLKKEINKLEKRPISERQKVLGEGYAMGVRAFEKDENVQEEVKKINALVYVAAQDILKKTKSWTPIINYRQFIKGSEDKLPAVALVYEAGLRWSLEYFETIYKRLGTKFDGYYPESWVGEYGMQLVEKGLKMGVLEKSDGGIIYRGEEEGLHTRVFVNKLGLPTYEAKDLGLALAKQNDFPYDLSINVFGKEIDEYYKVVRSAMLKITPDLGKKASYIAHGMVKLPEGKMSSRWGNVVTFEWLLKEVTQHALHIMKEVHVTLEEKEKEHVAEIVGLGAVRFALLKNSPGSDVVFDFKKSISFEGDSGPYLQYTYARCRSVMRKAKIKQRTKNKEQITNNKQQKMEKITLNEEERGVLRTILHFNEVVVDAARGVKPNLISLYLFQLAQQYNEFYHKHQILKLKTQNSNLKTKQVRLRKEESEEKTEIRLAITQVTAEVIKRCLFLLGIETVERM